MEFSHQVLPGMSSQPSLPVLKSLLNPNSAHLREPENESSRTSTNTNSMGMNMDTQSRPQPNLKPIWTDYQNLGGYPKTSFRVARSPLFPASPMTARSLPSPMHPVSAGYDPAMQKHERALVESLNQRGVQTPASARGTGRSLTLTPIAEQTARLDQFVVGTSPVTTPQLGDRTPTSARQPDQAQAARRRTLVAETRSLLLSGMPQSTVGDLGLPVTRRASVQSPSSAGTESSTPTTPTPRRNSQQLQKQLQSWGHVYLGDGTSAECFVAAVALRRGSDSSSGDDDPSKLNQLTVRARVRPRALERKPFLIQRQFDLIELRNTILDPPSPTSATYRRQSADTGMNSPAPQSPESVRRHSTTTSFPNLSKALARFGQNTVPIHLRYARPHLPVLAALMVSGHIRTGDIIDLPMPHPEAWVQTVAHIYTGQGELTEAMKQNIVYLAGKPTH